MKLVYPFGAQPAGLALPSRVRLPTKRGRERQRLGVTWPDAHKRRNTSKRGVPDLRNPVGHRRLTSGQRDISI